MSKSKNESGISPDVLKKYNGDLLDGFYDGKHLKKIGLYDRMCKKMARYWCYHFRKLVVHEQDPQINSGVNPEKTAKAPKGFREFVESLEGFTGWPKFSETWDLYGSNPYMIVHRLVSVEKEWEYVMERVAIPIDSTKEEVEARVAALTKDYARRNK